MNTPPIEVLITVKFPEEFLQPLKEISPRLHITLEPARKPEEIADEVWKRTEILYTDRAVPEPGLVPNLRWVQFHYAGLDLINHTALMQNKQILFTGLSGASAPQVAEYSLMMLLALAHRMPEIIQNQNRAEWPKDRWERFSPQELRGSTVGLVGYGSIGREIARLLQPFNVTILAAKRDAMHPQDQGYMPEGLGDPEGNYFHRLYPMEALKSMLKACDFVVVSLPLTASTRGLIGESELNAMKSTACLVDVGRGGVIDQAALIEALQNRKIAAAALDVFTEEPLPANNPLWKMLNVLVSPHVAGISPHYQKRAVPLFAENLRRYVSGGTLLNLFDPELGY